MGVRFVLRKIEGKKDFWGAEVKAGKVVTIADAECPISITQIAVDKGIDGGSALVYVRVDGKRFVVGTLSQNVPQISCELTFEDEFSLSHSLKSGSVYFLGSRNKHDSDLSDDYETDTDDPEDNLAEYQDQETDESMEDEQEVETQEKKKGLQAATPHPAKKGGKSRVNANQSPKSGGQSSAGNKKQFNSGKQFGSNKGNKGKGKGRA